MRVFREDFDTSLWGNWLRIATQLLVLGSVLLSLPLICIDSSCLVISSAMLLVLSCLGVVYNILFGLRLPQVGICGGDLEFACMETDHCEVKATQQDTVLQTWEALLFSFALCSLLATLPLLIASILRSKAWTVVRPQDSEQTLAGLKGLESPHDLTSIERSTRNLIITDPAKLEENERYEAQRTEFRKEDFNWQRKPVVVAFKHHPVL